MSSGKSGKTAEKGGRKEHENGKCCVFAQPSSPSSSSSSNKLQREERERVWRSDRRREDGEKRVNYVGRKMGKMGKIGKMMMMRKLNWTLASGGWVQWGGLLGFLKDSEVVGFWKLWHE